MTYALWDITINRNLGEYAFESDALAEVLALVEHFGDEHADNLILVGGADDNDLTGAALVQRARELAPVHAG